MTAVLKKRQTQQRRKSSSSQRVALVTPDETNLWLATWVAASSGAKGPMSCLPRVLLLLPSQSIFLPPSRTVVATLKRIVHAQRGAFHGRGDVQNVEDRDVHFRNQESETSRELERISLLEGLLCVVRDRLLDPSAVKRIPGCDCDLILSSLTQFHQQYSDLVVQVLATTSILNSTLRTRLTRLLSEAERYLRLYSGAVRSHQKIRNAEAKSRLDDASNTLVASTTERKEPSWRGWHQPDVTLGWLLDHTGAWQDIPTLSSSYIDTDEYASTLRRVWTVLTFYWGSGALWPRCYHAHANASRSQACNEPMLHLVNPQHSSSHAHASSVRCRKCKQSATWRCSRRSHRDAVCDLCLQAQQNLLMGSPSNSSSTDVYDCFIKRETTRAEGSVFILHQVRSRRPPAISTNWRTTYRLNCSSLVAVVPLSAYGEPLTRDHAVMWAEVVAVQRDSRNDDYKFREKQQMAIRLLTRADCSSLPFDVHLETGDYAAIIDLRVFVPEVFSVLSAFADHQFASHLQQIPFIARLIHNHESTSTGLGQVFSSTQSAREIIEKAVLTSEIEQLQRLTSTSRARLATRICNITSTANLYGTQLQAFAYGLNASVHVTQGPPGTGKVCLRSV